MRKSTPIAVLTAKPLSTTRNNACTAREFSRAVLQLRMDTSKKRTLRGILCTTIGGVCSGFSSTCGQYLFSEYQVSSLWLTCVRLLAGGSLLILLALPKHRTDILGILRNRRDVIQLSLYGIFGLLLCQYAYMTAISHSNAPTTTVLQNFALVLVMLYTCLRSRRLPTRIEAFALVLALAGVYLLATGGNPTQMVLSVPGLSWNLVSASAVALYILLPVSVGALEPRSRHRAWYADWRHRHQFGGSKLISAPCALSCWRSPSLLLP